MIVDSTIPAPLSYTDPTYQVALDVRAAIWDISTGTPALVTTINLTYMSHGLYSGQYQFLYQHRYVVQYLVYTGGVVDTTFGQQTDEIQAAHMNSTGGTTLIGYQNSMTIESLDTTMTIETEGVIP